MMMRALMIGVGLMALSGCAKEAALVKGDMPALGGSLEGGPWLVEDLNGGGIPDGVRVDATFEPGDHDTSVVFGASGCNRFRGGWKQTGATVKFGPLAGTMMMCEPAKMDTERKFLQTMEAVTTVSFDATGAALLKAPDGRAIKLRREKK
jgi:heat shock protein HslJ